MRNFPGDCRQFNWRQPNGNLKEGICRTLLVRLERKNMIKLPEPIRMPEPVPAGIKPKPVKIDQTPIQGTVEEIKNRLSVLDVKKTTQENHCPVSCRGSKQFPLDILRYA